MLTGLQMRELLCMHQYFARLLCSCLQVYQGVYLPSVLCLGLQVCVMDAAYCLTSCVFCVHPQNPPPVPCCHRWLVCMVTWTWVCH
jgi:hypothetical protein